MISIMLIEIIQGFIIIFIVMSLCDYISSKKKKCIKIEKMKDYEIGDRYNLKTTLDVAKSLCYQMTYDLFSDDNYYIDHTGDIKLVKEVIFDYLDFFSYHIIICGYKIKENNVIVELTLEEILSLNDQITEGV